MRDPRYQSEEQKETLLRIAKIIDDAIGTDPNLAFTLFLFDSRPEKPDLYYISRLDRKTNLSAIREWIKRQEQNLNQEHNLN